MPSLSLPGRVEWPQSSEDILIAGTIVPRPLLSHVMKTGEGARGFLIKNVCVPAARRKLFCHDGKPSSHQPSLITKRASY